MNVIIKFKFEPNTTEYFVLCMDIHSEIYIFLLEIVVGLAYFSMPRFWSYIFNFIPFLLIIF